MPNKRRRLVGRVISDKMQKTVVVAIERRKLHPIYKKVVKLTKKVMAHDESDLIKTGALVRIVESRPLSKNKRWVVEAVLAEMGATTIGVLADEVIVSSPDMAGTAVNNPLGYGAEGAAVAEAEAVEIAAQSESASQPMTALQMDAAASVDAIPVDAISVDATPTNTPADIPSVDASSTADDNSAEAE